MNKNVRNQEDRKPSSPGWTEDQGTQKVWLTDRSSENKPFTPTELCPTAEDLQELYDDVWGHEMRGIPSGG
jgi:hypothetical protein